MSLTLRYDGDALASGRMGARDLASALLAMSDLIQEVSSVASPDRPPPTVEIEATATGSFDIHLLLTEGVSVWRRAAELLTSDNADATANLTALTSVVVAIFRMTVKKARTQVQNRTPLPSGRTRISYVDGTSIEVPTAAAEASQIISVQRATRLVVAPLNEEGVDILDVIVDNRKVAHVTKGDLPGFDLPPSQADLLVDVRREAALTIVTVSFTEGNKWRFSDGSSTLSAVVEDQDFLTRVRTNEETFARDDILRCVLRTRQWVTDTGLRTEHSIIQVLSHLRGSRQTALPFE